MVLIRRFGRMFGFALRHGTQDIKGRRRLKPSSDGLRHLHDTGIRLRNLIKTACLCSPGDSL